MRQRTTHRRPGYFRLLPSFGARSRSADACNREHIKSETKRDGVSECNRRYEPTQSPNSCGFLPLLRPLAPAWPNFLQRLPFRAASAQGARRGVSTWHGAHQSHVVVSHKLPLDILRQTYQTTSGEPTRRLLTSLAAPPPTAARWPMCRWDCEEATFFFFLTPEHSNFRFTDRYPFPSGTICRYRVVYY